MQFKVVILELLMQLYMNAANFVIETVWRYTKIMLREYFL